MPDQQLEIASIDLHTIVSSTGPLPVRSSKAGDEIAPIHEIVCGWSSENKEFEMG